MTECPHLNFFTNVRVGRLSEDDGGPITGYCAEIQIKCTDCGLPFRFIGVPAGNHYGEPRVSIDGQELRAPIEPAEHQKFQLRARYVLPPREKQ